MFLYIFIYFLYHNGQIDMNILKKIEIIYIQIQSTH